MLHVSGANCRTCFRSSISRFCRPISSTRCSTSAARPRSTSAFRATTTKRPTPSRPSLRRTSTAYPGIVDSHVYQVPDGPALAIDVDRARALEVGLGQQNLAGNLVTSLNNSLQLIAEFLAGPQEERELPARRADADVPDRFDAGSLDASGHRSAELSAADADERRELQSDQGADGAFRSSTSDRFSTCTPMCEGRDLDSAAAEIDKVIDAARKTRPRASRSRSAARSRR